MRKRRYVQLHEFSYFESLWFVGFTAILITAYRLLFIHTVVSFPHFVFWDYWCGVTSSGINLDTLFRVTFLLAATLVSLVVVLKLWRNPQGHRLISGVNCLTIGLLIAYALQPTLFFDGPYCRQAAGVIHNKVLEPIAGEAFSRPDGMRPVYGNDWQQTFWVEDTAGKIFPWRVTEIDSYNGIGWEIMLYLSDVPRNAVLNSVSEDELIAETSACVEDARQRFKPTSLIFSGSPERTELAWNENRLVQAQEFRINRDNRDQIDEIFNWVKPRRLRQLDTRHLGFTAFFDDLTGTTWVPFEKTGLQLPWIWLGKSVPDIEFWLGALEVQGAFDNFLICDFNASTYSDFAVLYSP